MNMMVLFDVIIGALGIYLLVSAFKMKKTGIISPIIVNPDEIVKCKDSKGFIQKIFPSTVVFGVIAIGFSVFGSLCDLKLITIGYFNLIGVFFFLGFWLYFTYVLRKLRKEFFY